MLKKSVLLLKPDSENNLFKQAKKRVIMNPFQLIIQPICLNLTKPKNSLNPLNNYDYVFIDRDILPNDFGNEDNYSSFIAIVEDTSSIVIDFRKLGTSLIIIQTIEKIKKIISNYSVDWSRILFFNGNILHQARFAVDELTENLLDCFINSDLHFVDITLVANNKNVEILSTQLFPIYEDFFDPNSLLNKLIEA